VKSFDLVLVVGYFRSATAYLSIIRHLSPGLRIGVIQANADTALKEKTGSAEALFMELCVRFGAEAIEGDVPVRTKMLIVQQFPYAEHVVASINARVHADARAGLMTLSMAGVEHHDRFLAQFGITKLYVPSRRLMEFLVERRQAASRYEGLEIVEIGLPYRDYPIFPEFEVDYLIVAPTTFSFRSEEDKRKFLQSVMALLSELPPDATVAYKPHNGHALDYFTPRLHYLLGRIALSVPGAVRLLELAVRKSSGHANAHLNRVLSSVLHLQVLKRVTPISRLTPYSSIGVEAFYPGVRKGVIGGLSNTTWGALYFDIDYYNCVDLRSWRDSPRRDGFKNPADRLELNLEYFALPCCSSLRRASSEGQTIVAEADRAGDLISAVRNDLASLHA
jgi:hypothetical protein